MGIIIGFDNVIGVRRRRGNYTNVPIYLQYADGSNVLFADGSPIIVGTKRVPISKVPNPFLAGDGSQLLFQDGSLIACEMVKEQVNN